MRLVWGIAIFLAGHAAAVSLGACGSHSAAAPTSTGPGSSTSSSPASGTGAASSSASAANSSGTGGSSGSSSSSGSASNNCFASPGACGFPDPAYGNVGPSSPCSSLKASGSLTVSQPGATVENLNVTGSITVTADNVTIKNVCVSFDGSGNINNGPAVAFNASGGVIESSTVRGANATDQSVQAALAGSGMASHVYLYNCGECLHDGPWTVKDSYIEANAADFQNGYLGDAGQGPEDHHEGVYLASSSFVGDHNTIFNPHDETATVFGDTYNSPGNVCANQITVTNSLLAGGGYSLYTCASSSAVGTSTTNVSNNRFARCGTKAVFDSKSGGRACEGGPDTHGYWPFGGYYGVVASNYCPPVGGQVWSGNVWDDNGTPIPCGCLDSAATCYADSDCCSSTCTLPGDADAGQPGTCI